MANKLYDETAIQAIADSIRAKNGSSDTYTVSQMSAAIDNIPSGGTTEIYKKTWLTGHTYTLTSDGTLTITSSSDTFMGKPDTMRRIIYCVKKVDATDPHILGTAQDEGFMYFVDGDKPSDSLNIEFEFSSSFYYIRNNAFRNAPITSFTIPSTVRYIDANAFNGSKITSIIIPASVERLGDSIFENCTALTTAEISQSSNTYSISVSCFRDCTSLTSVTIANESTSILANAFNGCTALTSVTLPSTVTSISSSAFRQCTSLQTIDISNVTNIDDYAFTDCTALTSVDISSIEDVGYETFYGCNNLVETVGTPGVFTIPDTLTTTHGDFLCLRNGQTPNLTTVVVGTGLTTTTDWMFGRQTALQSVTFNGVMTSIHSNTFINCTQSGLTIYFPNMTEAEVQALSGYSSKWGATNATIVCSDTTT